MPNTLVEREVALPVQRRAMITIIVSHEAPTVVFRFEDRYSRGPSSHRNIGPVGKGRYVLDLGLNVWRERVVALAVTVADAPADLRRSGNSVAVSLGEAAIAEVRLRDG